MVSVLKLTMTYGSMEFSLYVSHHCRSTLQEIMEGTLARHREYFDIYDVEDFDMLSGWSTLLVDIATATSIGRSRKR